jgi:hypothetical protein
MTFMTDWRSHRTFRLANSSAALWDLKWKCGEAAREARLQGSFMMMPLAIKGSAQFQLVISGGGQNYDDDASTD